MSWFSRKSTRREAPPGVLVDGAGRSPGMAAVVEHLRRLRDPAVLDLGASSSESLGYLSELAHDVAIQDVFHSSGQSEGQRAEAFRFRRAEDVSLPEPADGLFDAILAWDVLHYLPRAERPRFGARLAALCAPRGRVLVVASETARIPPTPIHFKILAEDRLEYVLSSSRVEPPGVTTRDVEQAFVPLESERIYQLRNGLRELVLAAPARAEARPGDDEPG